MTFINGATNANFASVSRRLGIRPWFSNHRNQGFFKKQCKNDPRPHLHRLVYEEIHFQNFFENYDTLAEL